MFNFLEMRYQVSKFIWGCFFSLTVIVGCRSYDTALMDAIRRQEIGNVQRLLEGGAKADQLAVGETQMPIEAAALGGDPEIVRMLLDAGANPDSALGPLCPIWLAIEGSHFDAAEALVDHGAHLNCAPQKGMSPLYAATMMDASTLAQKMVQKGADIHFEGLLGTALHEAAENGDLALVKLLVQKGADPRRINRAGETAAFLAAEMQHWELVAWLAQQGTPPDVPDALGNTVLHSFAAADDSLAIATCCAWAKNGNQQNQLGESALHIAAAKGNIAAAIALIEGCQVDPNLRDIHGLSPAGLAFKEGETEMVELLTERGARLR